MDGTKITSAMALEILKGPNDWPSYGARIHWDETSGVPLEEFTKSAIERLTTSDSSGARETGEEAAEHDNSAGRPERFLDIKERGISGHRLYIFYLNVTHKGEIRLRFVESGSRFIFISLNSDTNEIFLKENRDVGGGDSRVAAFTCNLDGLRSSVLADRVRKSDHNDVLRIPFYFNVRDPVLKAAPWVLSEHSHAHAHSGDIRTHGGVHPIPVALLSVDL